MDPSTVFKYRLRTSRFNFSIITAKWSWQSSLIFIREGHCCVSLERNAGSPYTAQISTRLTSQLPLTMFRLRLGATAYITCDTPTAPHDRTVTRRLTTGIRYEKCVVWRFRRCANVTECTYTNLYRMSQEERTNLREGLPYVKVYRYNPKHLYPKLNGYGDNKVWNFDSCYTLTDCQIHIETGRNM